MFDETAAPLYNTDTYKNDLGQERDFGRLVKTRRSLRFLSGGPIPDGLLAKILSYGLWAPSNCNGQTLRYNPVKDQAVRRTIAINGFSADMGYCTLAVIADYRFYPDGDIDSPLHDSATDVQNILLACHYYGVGACYISDQNINSERHRAALGVTKEYEKVTATLWMGNYEKAPLPPALRVLSEVLQIL